MQKFELKYKNTIKKLNTEKNSQLTKVCRLE